MSISAKLRWKRYVNELRFLHEEIELVGEIAHASGRDFQQHYEEYCARNNFDLAALNQQHSDRIKKLYQKKTGDQGADDRPQLDAGKDGSLILHEKSLQESISSEAPEQYADDLCDYQMTKDEAELHEVFNKLFRRLALVLHPDKLPPALTPQERNEKLKMFKEAKTALEERHYFVLVDLAEKFKISTPRNYAQQIRWMKKEIVILNQSLKQEKISYSYAFSECEEEHEKDALIKKFMMQIFGPQIFEILA